MLIGIYSNNFNFKGLDSAFLLHFVYLERVTKEQCLIRIGEKLGLTDLSSEKLKVAEQFLSQMASDLQQGRPVLDSDFDLLLGPDIRKLSKNHWTPIAVAQRACELMELTPSDRVLDIGSGTGKFCTVGALMSPAQFFGVEQRAHLVKASQKLAENLGAKRANFIWEKMENLDWDDYSVFYLFNPFWEHVNNHIRQDDSLKFNDKSFRWYTEVVEARLANMPINSRVVTYHGFGGTFPAGFSKICAEEIGTGALELWRK
jgi:predicted RNA methylase